MKQFYETYKDFPKLAPVVREISWTNNLTILSRANTIEEKEFYLRLCIQDKYSKRELERQISSRSLKSNMVQCSQYFILIKAIKNLQVNTTI